MQLGAEEEPWAGRRFGQPINYWAITAPPSSWAGTGLRNHLNSLRQVPSLVQFPAVRSFSPPLLQPLENGERPETGIRIRILWTRISLCRIRKKPKKTLLLSREPLRGIAHCIWVHSSRRLRRAYAGRCTPVNRSHPPPKRLPMRPPSLDLYNFASGLLEAQRREKLRKNIIVVVALAHRKIPSWPRRARSHRTRGRPGPYGAPPSGRKLGGPIDILG